MRITDIQIENFISIMRADIKIKTPICLFAGGNGVGKSTIRESVLMAMTGDVERVDLKKDYGDLVRDNGKAGGALIVTDAGSYQFNVPDGKVAHDDGLPTGEAVRIALNGQRFVDMTVDERRHFLFGLVIGKINKDDVRARLLAKNCEAAKFETLMPLLQKDFASAHETAVGKVKDCRADWKAVTGQPYGSKIAEGWRAEKPPVADIVDIVAGKAEIVSLTAEAATLNQEIGALAAEKKAAADAVTRRSALHTQAMTVDRCRDNLARAQKDVAEYEPGVIELRTRAAGKARVGLVHDMASFIYEFRLTEQRARELTDRYAAEHGAFGETVDVDAQARLPEQENGLKVLQNRATNLQRDLDAAIQAKADFEALGAAIPAVDDFDSRLEKIIARRDAMDERITKLRDIIKASEEFDAAVAKADEKTKKAGEHHAALKAWDLIADALSPSGVPGDLLDEALKPINATLRIAAADTGWMLAQIDADMKLTADGRRIGLLSKSEKWRWGAMFAQAVSKISKIKILMLDEVDILLPKGRVELLTWLDNLASDGVIDTALLFCSMKAEPKGLPDTITSFWVEDGVVREISGTES